MKSIAIIGTGIAGMGCGYFLKGKYDISFYEKNNYSGGHTNTLTINEDGQPIYIDSGFIVYNEVTYPNLTRLFKELDVTTMPTTMSFSVQHLPSGLEYSGAGLGGLFVQKKNIFSRRYWRMLGDMDRFNKEAPEVLENDKYLSYTILDYVKENKFCDDFLSKFLVPISSAVWSTPFELLSDFPIVTLVRFFKNHGFLGLYTHYQWRTVIGGSRIYRDKILDSFKGRIFLNRGATKIIRENDKVVVYDAQGQKASYDKVIIASHADEALGLLAAPTELEKKLLVNFKYQKNHVTLHTDRLVMPKSRRAWSAWNSRIEFNQKGQLVPSTIYYMNSLQKVSNKKDYFISVNDPGGIDRSKIIWENDYTHPIYNVTTIEAQGELPKLNQNGSIYFCGSYFRYGFHEDAFNSALDVASLILGKRVWS